MSAMYGAGRLAVHLARPDDQPAATRGSDASRLAGAADLMPPRRPPTPLAHTSAQASDGARGRWVRVLRELDQRREQAWRLGNARRLGAVYLPHTATLSRDRAMLDAYASRGFRVADARLSFLRVRLIDREAGKVVLRTVDELSPATAKHDDGRSLALPRDLPSQHVIVLERRGHEWRIGSVGGL
jgi:hypothetical protein